MEEVNGRADLVKLSFIGDITCDRPMLKAARSLTGYNFEKQFKDVKSLFENAYVIGNLETVFAGEKIGWNTGYVSYNTPDNLAKEMKRAGIDMVTTANNHCSDCGLEGIKRTIKILEKYQIEHTGTFCDKREKRYLIKEIDGIKIAIVSCTYPLNTDLLQGNYEYINLLSEGEYAGISWKKKCIKKIIPQKIRSKLLEIRADIKRKKGDKIIRPYIDNYEERKTDSLRIQNMKDLLKDAKKEADLVVLAIHQGGQFNTEPGTHSKQICRQFLPYVDAIIGNHPHVVQEVNQKMNKLVVFSLGSFNLSLSADYVRMDDFPNYSIMFNLYLNKQTKRIEYTSFSILVAVEDEKKYVRVCSVDKLYEQIDESKKDKLKEEIINIYNRFSGKNVKEINICREYKLN